MSKIHLHAKKSSGEEYINSLESTTHPREIWNEIKSINGRHAFKSIKYINNSGTYLYDTVEISEKTADNFEMFSSSENSEESFLNPKDEAERPLEFGYGHGESYNARFS
ncbi:hypothetical protein JTB14_018175 [Gonioctena quinquepunctata]|nr:hypothetical protein JTB14_018175 [Gonioctena quinquepunctata]